MLARILVADDNSDVRSLLRHHLQTKHHEVLEAEDGAQAFVMAEKEVPHLIIMDLIMPGVYGSSASAKLRDYWRTSKIPVIIVSGSTEAAVRDLLEENDRMRFLKKPIDFALLDKTIAELLPFGGYVP